MRHFAILLAGVGCAGCGAGGDRLIVATDWPPERCAAIDSTLAARGVVVRWVRVAGRVDPTMAAQRRSPLDVVLGGPLSSHVRLAVRGRTAPFHPDDAQPWRVIARSPTDPPPECDPAPIIATAFADGQPPEPVEGVSLMKTSTHVEQARAFLAALPATRPDPDASSLLSVLLDAMLSGARPEWVEARSALERHGNPARQVAWMTEPPPWPPASITRMRTRPDGPALIKLLAKQVAPDTSALAWLVESFERVPATIDGPLLNQIDEAAGGRLAADPRFRSWLRSEWSTWARQRDRRVIRNLQPRGRASG